MSTIDTDYEGQAPGGEAIARDRARELLSPVMGFVAATVGFAALARIFRRARAASLDIPLDDFLAQFQAGWAAVDDAAECRSMTLAERGNREQVAECVARHA